MEVLKSNEYQAGLRMLLPEFVPYEVDILNDGERRLLVIRNKVDNGTTRAGFLFKSAEEVDQFITVLKELKKKFKKPRKVKGGV